MQEYKFLFKGKEYVLNEENLDYLLNDEEKPIENIEFNNIISILCESDKVDFENSYYSKACEECGAKAIDNKKIFEFLEFHFYIFTKGCKYIISSISKDYVKDSFSYLERMGKVDDSYIVSIIVCGNCGKYSIEIEELEM